MKQKFLGFVALSRWKEIYDYTIALTLIGAIFAGASLDFKILLIFFANFLMQIFVFSFNDAEDAEDDAKDPKKAKRNPVSNKSISKREAYIFSFCVAGLAFLLTLILSISTRNLAVIVVAIVTLLTMFFYNWLPVRFKGMRVLDIVSHAYALGGSIFLFTFLAYSQVLSLAGWLGFISLSFISAYGQFENQTRDFVVDQLCKLKNTTDLIGLKAAEIVKYFLLACALLMLVYYAVTLPDFLKILPWLIAVYPVAIAIPLIRYAFIRERRTLIQDFHRILVAASYLLLFLRLIHFI